MKKVEFRANNNELTPELAPKLSALITAMEANEDWVIPNQELLGVLSQLRRRMATGGSGVSKRALDSPDKTLETLGSIHTGPTLEILLGCEAESPGFIEALTDCAQGIPNNDLIQIHLERLITIQRVQNLEEIFDISNIARVLEAVKTHEGNWEEESGED